MSHRNSTEDKTTSFGQETSGLREEIKAVNTGLGQKVRSALKRAIGLVLTCLALTGASLSVAISLRLGIDSNLSVVPPVCGVNSYQYSRTNPDITGTGCFSRPLSVRPAPVSSELKLVIESRPFKKIAIKSAADW